MNMQVTPDPADPAVSEPLDAGVAALIAAEIDDDQDGVSRVRQFVTFHLGSEVFAVDMGAVREIIRVPDVTRVPLAPSALEGVANLRGAVVPIVSLRRLLSLEHRDVDEASRAVVVDVGQPVGFVVDRVSSVISVDPGQIETAQEGGSTIDADYLAGMIKNAGGHGITMIADLARLIEQQFAMITAAVQADTARLRTMTTVQDADDDTTRDEIHLVNFVLAGQEYGIAIADVQEIVHLPGTITRLPQTPHHVLGVMTLRSRLLPLIDLRAMFGLATGLRDDKTRILVLRLGTMSVGLVVDTVSEVLRVGIADLRDLPDLIATRGDASDITRVCQLQGGKRLVAIVNGHVLFDHPTVRSALDAAGNAEPDAPEHDRSEDDMEDDTAADDQRQLVIFRLGDEEFGVPIQSVKEILRVPAELFWVPKSADCVEGVINLRGAVLPVIDLRSRLGMVRNDAHDRQRIMVLQRGGAQTGFVVDHVAQVLVVCANAIEPAPTLSEHQSRLLPHVANLVGDKRMLQLLDPASLIEDYEAAARVAA